MRIIYWMYDISWRCQDVFKRGNWIHPLSLINLFFIRIRIILFLESLHISQAIKTLYIRNVNWNMKNAEDILSYKLFNVLNDLISRLFSCTAFSYYIEKACDICTFCSETGHLYMILSCYYNVNESFLSTRKHHRMKKHSAKQVSVVIILY